MAVCTQKELQLLQKRFAELAEKSRQRGICLYTGFLSLAEQEAFIQVMDSRQETEWRLWGGREDCERRMACVGDASMDGANFPIGILSVVPCSEHFGEELSHRDVLGAVMHLGIERSVVGDILIEGKHAWLFSQERMLPYLAENLTRIRHTDVTCTLAGADRLPPPATAEQKTLVVSSPRLDAVLSGVYRLSRAQGQELLSEGRVYVNGRACQNNSTVLKEGDLVTLRGSGRFIVLAAEELTRKGRLRMHVGVWG